MRERSKTQIARWSRRVITWLSALVFLALAGGNALLNTPLMKKRIGGRLASLSGGVPPELGTVTYFPWSGLRVRDLKSEAFSAKAFHLEVKMLSLLTRDIRIRKVTCESPRFHIVQKERPVVLAVAAPNPQSAGSRAGIAPSPKAGATPPPVPRDQVPVSAGPARRTLSLDALAMNDAEFVLLAPDGRTEQFRIEGLKVEVDLADMSKVSGTFAAAKSALLGRLEAEDAEGEFHTEGSVLRLEKVSAACRGGRVRGALALDLRAPGGPFKGRFEAADISIDGLGGEFKDLPVRVRSGKASGKLVAQGHLQAPRHARGEMLLQFEGATLAMSQEFGRFKRALRINDENLVELEEMGVMASFANGEVTVKSASARSGDIVVKSCGYAGLSGDLNLSVRLYLGSSVHHALVARAEADKAAAFEFEGLEGTELRYRDFHVVGTLDEPRTDFWRNGKLVSLSQIMSELRFEFEMMEAVPVNIDG